MANEIFGPLWSATSSEAAIISHLQYWFSQYLAIVEEREAGWASGDIARPKTWQADIDVNKMPEEQVPAILVVVGDETPEKDGQFLHLFVSIAIGVIVRGSSRAQARDVARLYTAAIRGSLLHHPDVTDHFAHLSYEGADYGEVTGDAGVVAATSTVVFTALVPNAVDLYAGPGATLPHPPDVPVWPTYPDYGDVQETHVIVHPDDDTTD